MSKQKKKNIFQKLADIDAQQEKAIRNRNSKTNKSTNETIVLSKRTRIALIVLSLILPFLAWGLGALVNPSGWLSDEPGMILYMIFIMLTAFWFFTLPLAILVIYLIIRQKKDAATILVFAISFAVSLYVTGVTASARESEFTD